MCGSLRESHFHPHPNPLPEGEGVRILPVVTYELGSRVTLGELVEGDVVLNVVGNGIAIFLGHFEVVLP